MDPTAKRSVWKDSGIVEIRGRSDDLDLNTISNDVQLDDRQGSITFAPSEPITVEIEIDEVLRHGLVQVNHSYPPPFTYKRITIFLLGDTAWQ